MTELTSIRSEFSNGNPTLSVLHFGQKALILLLAVPVASMASTGAGQEKVDFRRQVQPILADRCFHCHGPDSQNQDSSFRLDSQENLLADLGGYAGVVPGNLEKSELHVRIHSDDESVVMPPPDSNRSLSAEEKRILDLWIQQGAEYQKHWAFEVPQRPEVPTEAIEQSDWPEELKQRWSKNPIDVFIGKRLMEEGWQPSPMAEPAWRLRRAALTLTGQLPPESLQKEFLANPTEEAYRHAVDQLLSSMNYAERQTLRWLDAARFADTDGYQNDFERTNWPWRDWVIEAMHNNMPFDQFTIEQLAGDMLPNPTPAQRLATAFNRNHRQNAEGGALAEEFFVENVIDRVETTSTVWLGLTMGCARCHDHKYDPLSQREFYQFFGYFNNIGERGIGAGRDSNPLLKASSPFAKVQPETIAQWEAAQKSVEVAKQGIDERMRQWLVSSEGPAAKPPVEWQVCRVDQVKLTGEGSLEIAEENSVRYSGGSNATDIVYDVTLHPPGNTLTALKLEALPDAAFNKPRQLAPSVNGNFVMTRLAVIYQGKSIPVELALASFEQDSYPVKNILDNNAATGWAVFGPNVKADPVSATLKFQTPIEVNEGDGLTLQMRFESQYANHAIGKFRVQGSTHPDAGKANEGGLPEAARNALAIDEAKRSDQDWKAIRDHYVTIDPILAKAELEFKQADQRRRAEVGPEVNVMVMREKEGTATPIYLLDRGQYNEPLKDEPLSRGVPVALLASKDAPQPGSRLELAKWLVSRENPLTARVIVNRIWQDHFGVGLVKTSEDFGLQGEVPSHPELLDWLAVEFIESGWDLQALHRLMVTSAAYQQSSVQTIAQREKDPENRLLLHGPRFRLDGYSIRDIALQASGLLHQQIGGPSVKPYQPPGLWESVAANAGTRYREDQGNNLYRKSMYTYWKRAVNPPRQTIFDAGGREVCTVGARRTNTPLQALVLMNDKTFIEAARTLAQRSLKLEVQDDRDRLFQMYQQALAHAPDDETMNVLTESLNYYRQHFQENPDAAQQLVAVGSSPRDASIEPGDHAAWTAVAHLVLNLDEFITVE